MKLSCSLIASLLFLSLIFSIGCQQATPVTSLPPSPGLSQTPISAMPGPVSTSSPVATIAPSTPTAQTHTPAPATSSGPTQPGVPETSPSPSSLKVTFIDLGQADCTIVRYGSNAMLIDAGSDSTAASLISKIKDIGINKFDVAVGTCPQDEHIGGLDTVIDNFDIETLYMPAILGTTKASRDVLTAINGKGLTVTHPIPGDSFTLGNEVKCDILAPNGSSYPDLGGFSIVIKMTYGETSFLFTGDADEHSEKEMLAKGFDLKSDVLKAGCHGGVNSTSAAFLKEVAPKYGVIFAGMGNPYELPHQETLDKLNKAGIIVYRTDLNGDIVCTSDGSDLTVIPSTTKTLPSPDHSPVPTPPGDITLDIVPFTSPVKAGGKATLSARTAPGAWCEITVYYDSGPITSMYGALSPRKADNDGNVSWTWTVGSDVPTGSWLIVVKADLNGKSVARNTSLFVQGK